MPRSVCYSLNKQGKIFKKLTPCTAKKNIFQKKLTCNKTRSLNATQTSATGWLVIFDLAFQGRYIIYQMTVVVFGGSSY